jgi:hypothetical protein
MRHNPQLAHYGELQQTRTCQLSLASECHPLMKERHCRGRRPGSRNLRSQNDDSNFVTSSAIHHGPPAVSGPPDLNNTDMPVLPSGRISSCLRLIFIWVSFCRYCLNQSYHVSTGRPVKMLPCYAPIYHTSTPSTSNLCPSSLRDSFPNVGHGSLIPRSSCSSSQRP